MKKKFLLLGILGLLVCVQLSGCDQISNVFLSDEDKLEGTWKGEGIWLDAPTLITFFSNNTVKLEVKMGTIDFTLSEGYWDINDKVLTIEIVELNPPTHSYTYQFSEDNKKLTLTNVSSSISYVLTKQ